MHKQTIYLYEHDQAFRSSYSLTSSLPSPLPQALSQNVTGSLTASVIAPSRTRQGLKDAAVQYCLRVIDQCERSE